MRVKLFTFRYSPTLGGFDDTVLRDFIRNKEILSFREHFFRVQQVPHFTCIVTYQDTIVPADAVGTSDRQPSSTSRNDRNRDRSSRKRPDEAAGLSEPDRILFNAMREWRMKKSRDEGAPPYVILTNRELVQIIEKKPESLTALGQIEGIGAAKIRRHGKEVLAQLHGHLAARTSETAVPPDTGNDSEQPEVSET